MKKFLRFTEDFMYYDEELDENIMFPKEHKYKIESYDGNKVVFVRRGIQYDFTMDVAGGLIELLEY